MFRILERVSCVGLIYLSKILKPWFIIMLAIDCVATVIFSEADFWLSLFGGMT